MTLLNLSIYEQSVSSYLFICLLNDLINVFSFQCWALWHTVSYLSLNRKYFHATVSDIYIYILIWLSNFSLLVHKNAIYFCMSTLYDATTLISSLVSPSSTLKKNPLDFLHIKPCCLWIKTFLLLFSNLYSFYCYYSLYCLYCFKVLAKTSCKLLNSNDERIYFFLVPNY